MILGVMYSVGALVMLVVGVVLLVRRGRSEPARNVAMAALVSAGWAAIMVSQSPVGTWPTWNAMMADGFRFGAWLIALQALISSETPAWLRRVSLGACAALIIYTSVGGISQSFDGAKPLHFDALAGFITALAALAATLHVWRHALQGESRSVRWCAAAVGGQFAIDALTYAQAQWQGNVHLSLSALRLAVVLLSIVPLVRVAWRLPVSEPRLFISRQVMFYSSSFAFLALYFALTTAAAFYARRIGGENAALWQTLVIGIAAVAIIVFLSAESPARRLRVFISKHFYRNKYDYRIEWLRFVQTLSAGAEPDAQRNAVRAVAQIFDSPSGLLMLREQSGNRFYLQAAWPEHSADHPDVSAMNADDDLPRFLMDKQWVVDLREFKQQPQRYDHMKLPHWISKGRWRVVAPLLVGNHLIGFLLLQSPPEPFTITFEDLDLLKTVGRNVGVQLAQRRADEQLAESRQFDAYNRFAAFVMHDLKNSVAQLQLLVANAARHRHNPVFVEDAIDTIRNTSERMTRLIEQLQGRDMQGTARTCELGAVVANAVGRSQSRGPRVAVEGDLNGALVVADPERLTAILEHVVRNAQEASGSEGNGIVVRLRSDEKEAHVTVIDEGTGMDEEFLRHRLFRPFDSTKGSKGMGIGAYQVREYARAVGGDVDVWSAPGRGTKFCIRLPLCRKKNPGS